MIKTIRAQTGLLAMFALLFGLLYPTVVWISGKAFFPFEAKGSLIVENGKTVGSVLIGQPFAGGRYFASRPSATRLHPYNFYASGGSNLNPAHPELLQRVQKDLARFPPHDGAVPADLITSSGSGLDPHISPQAAFYQAHRVAMVRHLPLSTVERLIDSYTQEPTFGFLGQRRVNVLELNRALDRQTRGYK